jgi:OOP family OmpA-OmpF porin
MKMRIINSRLSSALSFVFSVGLALVFTQRVSAQASSNTERFVPALDPEGFITVQGTRTPGSLLWNIGLFISYSYDPLVVTAPDDESVSVVDHRLTTDISAEAGLGGRFALAFLAPLAAYQKGDSLSRYRLDEPRDFAVGDPTVALRDRFIGDNSDEEREHHDGPGLAIQFNSALPVGMKEALFNQGGVTTQLIGDFHLLGAGVGMSLGWVHFFETQDYYFSESDAIRHSDEIGFALGFKMPIPWVPEITGLFEIGGNTDATAPFSDWKTTPIEIDLGARMQVGEFSLNAAVGAGLSEGFGAPVFRAIAGVWWSPRTSDSDSDKIDDDEDQCPQLAEDPDGFQDEDGCPDPDNDGDWVLDLDDRCPFEAADENHDWDEDGCTDKN